MAKDTHKMSLMVLTISFWTLLIVIGIIIVAMEIVQLGIIILILALLFLCLLPSFFFGRELTFARWYKEVAMCGVYKLGLGMSMLGRPNGKNGPELWYEGLFVFYWGFTIKYLIPIVLWLILCSNVKNDFDSPYGGYDTHW